MEVENGENMFDRREAKTMTMNWEALGEFEDDDVDKFFETRDRLSSAMSFDIGSSSDEDEDFDDYRLSFSSAVSSFTTVSNASRKFRAPAMSADYDIWMAAPGSISERRRRLLHGMGLASNKNLLPAISIQRNASNKAMVSNGDQKEKDGGLESKEKDLHEEEEPHHAHLFPVLLVRSRSESDIEKFSIEKCRKEELLGKISKQRLTKTTSTIAAPQSRLCQNQTAARGLPMVARNGRAPACRSPAALTSMISNSRFGAFFLIKNLDTGNEFIVNEYDEDGMWNRLSDLQTGKQLTLEEFEKCVGYSPVVKDLMRRENVSRINYESFMDLRKFNSYLSKSLRLSKRRGVALLKNIKDVAHSMSLRVTEKDGTDGSNNSPRKSTDNKQGKSNKWVKVRSTGKSCKELSALHMCQEIQAHEGAIWTIKFSVDARYLASAGEDRVIHVWEVQECEIMSMAEGSLTPIHPSLSDSMELSSVSDIAMIQSENKKKGKSSSGRRGNQIPEYVHVPETVFSFSDKPICSFKGHLDDILDLSWSKSQLLLSSSMDKTVRLWNLETRSCLKLFAHNDYVTCIQFNPVDENYFISGSLDAKVRIWNIPSRHVVEWSDLHEMATAACYTPNGQGAVIGSHKGICRVYNTEDCKLSQTNQIDVRSSKSSQARKKITGFQFSPVSPSEVLVTSADSRIRMLDGSQVIHKFKGFKNNSSQISASYSQDGKYIICASEDSQVYLWRREIHRTNTGTGKGPVITTQSHEHFQCKDVSVAIPWHGQVQGEPPPVQMHSKRHSKRMSATTAISQLPSATGSPTKEETSAKMSAANNKKPRLPPIPKKIVTQTFTDEETGQSRDSEPGYSESFRSNSSSSTKNWYDSNSEGVPSRFGDSPSINTSSRIASWSWLDGANHGAQTVQTTAWGMVIVTATLGGEIRAYQNFGLPRRISRQTSFLYGSMSL